MKKVYWPSRTEAVLDYFYREVMQLNDSYQTWGGNRMEKQLNILLYLPQAMADWEVGLLMAELNTGRFLRAGVRVQVTTTAATEGPVQTMGGLSLLPQKALAEVDEACLDALILPGGESWADPAANREVLALAARLSSRSVLVAGMCGATEALAATGLLDNVQHTGNSRELMASIDGYRGAPNYLDELVVADSKLVTAGSWAPIEFAAAVLAELDVFSSQTTENWLKFWAKRDVAGIYALMTEHQLVHA